MTALKIVAQLNHESLSLSRVITTSSSLLFAIASVFLLVPTAVGGQEEEIVTEVLMGMRIEKLADIADTGIRVVTTGAEFSVAKDGTIKCCQRIPVRRDVARITLAQGVFPFSVRKDNDFACVLASRRISLTVQGDSVIILRLNDDMAIRFKGLFRPAYHHGEKGRWMFMDKSGGFGVYPVGEKQTTGPNFDQRPWEVEYRAKKGDEIWFSVFPPRPYNWERSFESMAHEGNEEPYAYPSDELIQSTARHCKIMVVHSWLWPGGEKAPWYIPEFVPSDMGKFNRMRDAIRRNGMKLIPYVSPYYYKNPNETEGIFNEIRRVLNEYMADGVYFDGIAQDIRKSYHIVRKTRQILGQERILFRHCTTDPLNSNRIYCPFIDTYCDYIYRGESGRAGLELDQFLRWTISGYNISNAVGYWVYTGSTGKPGYVRQVPTREHIDAALRNEVRIPRMEIGYELNLAWEPNDGHLKSFDDYYYGKLRTLRDRYE